MIFEYSQGTFLRKLPGLLISFLNSIAHEPNTDIFWFSSKNLHCNIKRLGIDISSESLLFIFASNIYRSGFQTDVYSEIEKFLAHDNVPVIYTNIGNNMFDRFSDFTDNGLPKIIKLPIVNELYSLSIFEFYFENFTK